MYNQRLLFFRTKKIPINISLLQSFYTNILLLRCFIFNLVSDFSRFLFNFVIQCAYKSMLKKETTNE